MKKLLLTCLLALGASGSYASLHNNSSELMPYNAAFQVENMLGKTFYMFNPMPLPYSENFDAATHSFTLSNGTNVNKWFVGNAVSSSATNSLYISNNEGVSHAYTTSSAAGVSHAYTQIAIPATALQLYLSFDFKCGGESSLDYVRVWMVPDTFTPTAGTQITAAQGTLISLGPNVNNTAGNLNGTSNSLGTTFQTNFQNLVFTFNANAYAGQSAKLVFEWRNDGSVGTQPPAAIDNVILDVITCPAPTNLGVEVDCDDPSTAQVSWTPGGNETSWEYAVLPVGSPAPTTGTPVSTPNVQVEDLIVGQQYTFWVRANCGDGFSYWISNAFTAEGSPVQQAQPFCAESGTGGILFPNVSGQGNVYGSLSCLGSTPNPVWYYLTVAETGPLNFQIIQNTQFDANGNTTGTGLDVDFIAWGPFNSMSQACSQIDLDNPTQFQIACSYSAAAIENFAIPNAQQGQIYVLLITNFNGQPGWVKLHQTNQNAEGSGSTDCSFLCSVDLGQDIVVCENTEVTLTAVDSQAGGGSGEEPTISEIRWFRNGVLMDPNIYNTLQITVNEPGTYRIEVDKDNCTEEFATDEIVVTWVYTFKDSVPNKLRLCDYGDDQTESFDLNTYLNSLQIPAGNSYTLHANINDANAGTNPLTGNYSSGNSTIYLRIQSNELTTCFRIVDVTLELIPILKPSNFPIDDVNICTGYTLPELLENQEYTHYEELDPILSTHVINTIDEVKAGDFLSIGYYEVYVKDTTADGCEYTTSFKVSIIPCHLPQGISPNGDGLNDNLDLTPYRALSLKIYNRYGKEVYSYGLGYTNQWVGQDNNGNALPDGTYFIDLITPFERFTSWIQLSKGNN